MDRNEGKNNFKNVQNKRKKENDSGRGSVFRTILVILILCICAGGTGYQIMVQKKYIARNEKKDDSAKVSELEDRIKTLEGQVVDLTSRLENLEDQNSEESMPQTEETQNPEGAGSDGNTEESSSEDIDANAEADSNQGQSADGA